MTVSAAVAALANLASSATLSPPQRRAVNSGLTRAIAPDRLIRTTSLMVALGSPTTVCGLAGIRSRGERIDELVFIGRLDATRFRVSLIGRTGRDDFTVRNMCGAEGLIL